MACWKLTNRIPYLIYSISVCLLGGWRLIWLIIGAIMFWGDLYKRRVCAYDLSRYMWANLIIGFIGVPLCFILGLCYAKV